MGRKFAPLRAQRSNPVARLPISPSAHRQHVCSKLLTSTAPPTHVVMVDVAETRVKYGNFRSTEAFPIGAPRLPGRSRAHLSGVHNEYFLHNRRRGRGHRSR